MVHRPARWIAVTASAWSAAGLGVSSSPSSSMPLWHPGQGLVAKSRRSGVAAGPADGGDDVGRSRGIGLCRLLARTPQVMPCGSLSVMATDRRV
jgi:hypothetical protein